MSFDTKALKVGDEVFVNLGGYGHSSYERQTVTNTTPSGRVVLSDGNTYNLDGYERGGPHGRWSSRSRIVEPTEHVLSSVRRREATNALSAALKKWEDWPVERIEVVVMFINSVKQIPGDDDQS